MKILEEIIPGSRCKGPEAGMSLLHLRKRKRANVEGTERAEGREVRDKAREVSH